MEHTYQRFGLWDKLISDRGPQFAGQIMQGIHKYLGITSALSTAYHPQTDGETERFNQELEQYLRIYCNYRQDDWVKHLPFAEFSHNIRVHSATGKSPFELLHGFTPRLFPSTRTDSHLPSLENQLENLKQLQEEVEASLKNATEVMKTQHSNHLLKAPLFKVGDKVLLDGKNITTTRPKAKLSNKRHGPFEITEAIGTVNFRLKLPNKWQIHNVFHASLLIPWIETDAYRPPPPATFPDLETGVEKFDVEAILDSRKPRNGRGTSYLVKWLGYPESDNIWEPASNFSAHALELIHEFHRNNPTAYRAPAPRMCALFDLTIGDIWRKTPMLQAQAQPKEGVMSRIPFILT